MNRYGILVFVSLFFIICLAPCTVFASRPVTHNPEVIAAIDSEISATTSERYLAVLRGLAWCVAFCDDDENFDFNFGNYVTMLDELATDKSNPALRTIVHGLIVKEFERAMPRFPKLFAADAAGYEDFISVLPIAYAHQVPKEGLKSFARRHFAKVKPVPTMPAFNRAMRAFDYDKLTDFVVWTAFLDMAYSMGVDEDFRLPPDEYQTILAKCAEIEFKAGPEQDDYHDQNYYATHVVLAQSHYGRRPFTYSPAGHKVMEYLLGQYQTVRSEVGDLDLLCEYLYCFRQAGLGDSEFVVEGEHHILALQRSDGSWGTPRDFSGDPYDRMHPTWTAITLLALGPN